MRLARLILVAGAALLILASLACAGGGSGGSGGSQPGTPSPVAAFTFGPAAPVAGQAVTFTDGSSNTPTSWAWVFGDGGTSAVQNPAHAFTTAGTYTVVLTATNAGGSSATSRTVTVGPAVLAPAAAFSFSPAAPVAGQTVTFTDGSTHTPTAWSWAFGDGATSTQQNPTHAYAAAGTFTVTLTASNAAGSTQVSHAVTVSPAAVAPVAAFTFSPPAPAAAQTVTFTDGSTNAPTSWSWAFGDGATSAQQNPTHAYAAAGTFTVTLTAANGAGSSTATRSVTVAQGALAPAAAFTFSPGAPAPGQTVTFTDGSSNSPASWSWAFGDGATSTLRNPTHAYAAAGTYTVALTATNSAGQGSTTRSLTVSAASTSLAAHFTASVSGQTAIFTDTSTGNPTFWAWDFGDGQTSSVQLPTHAYATAGTYTVTLRASNNSGSSTVSTAVAVAPAAPQAGFNALRPTPAATLVFTDTSTGSPTSWSWDFGDGLTSQEQNPAHAYGAAGVYTVALTATSASGSTQTSRTYWISPLSNLLEVRLPASVYWMGDHGGEGGNDPAHPTDELPLHPVGISSMFVATTPTTGQQYCDYLNSALAQGLIEVRSSVVYAKGGTAVHCYLYGWAYQAGKTSVAYSIGFDGTSTFSIKDARAKHPVVGITLLGAEAYCNWLSAQAGLAACYDLATLACDFTRSGYRLPTEAEWEFAARGGRSPYANYPWGDDEDTRRANWPSSGNPYQLTDPATYPWTTPVGFYNGTLRQKSDFGWPGSATSYQTRNGANGFGLFDASGNVWQLHWDWYAASTYQTSLASNPLESSPAQDPTGPATGQAMTDGKPYRGMRGGSWFNGLTTTTGVVTGHGRVSNRCPAADEFFAVPAQAYSSNVGFRTVRANRTSSGTGGAADFTSAPATVVAGSVVAFTDASTNLPVSWAWDFGDGTGTSWIQNPKHVYAAAGTYTVTLTATAAGGSSASVSRTVTANSPASVLAASFTCTLSGRTATFTSTSTGNPTGYAWTFGDGGSGTGASPSHAYAADDIYTATLTVTGATGTSTFSRSVIVNTAVAKRTVGLMVNTSKALDGYTLFAPKQNKMTYLVNNEGRIVKQWNSAYSPGQSIYLLENGHLLHTCMITSGALGTGGGEGGRVEEYDWNGNLLWYYDLNTSTQRQHHDAKMLPNGNVLMLVVEKKTYAECVAAGFDMTKFQPDVATQQMLLPECLIEVKPDYAKGSGGTVVWEWHVWDHLIQDFDAAKANFGVVASHPERIDCVGGAMFWNHGNAVDYHPGFDQIALSMRNHSEVWIIDHSTTTAEAAGRTGGRRGKGGDLLYRWGNPSMYGVSKTLGPEKYWQQHDTEWIKPDCPGAGNITCFDNGLNRSLTDASSVEEFRPPASASGDYPAPASGSPYLPADYTWSYWGDATYPMYSENISGAQRLPNGNTIICSGGTGDLREVTYLGEVVWKYVCPVQASGVIPQGGTPATDPTHASETLNSVFRIYKYPSTYGAFAGRTLTVGDYIVK